MACSFRSPGRENLVPVIRNFISGVRFTKWAEHFLEAWHLKTGSLCAHCWLGAASGELFVGRLEDQTWLMSSMLKGSELSKKRQGPSPWDSEQTKRPLFCPDERQETSFNLIAFIRTFSRKLILMPLVVKIFWSGLESDNMSLDVFESKWRKWEIMVMSWYQEG